MTNAITSNSANTSNTTLIQVWTYRHRHEGNDVGGPIDVLTTETLDFGTLTRSAHSVGTHEGTRVNERRESPIDPTVTPERAAQYRQCNGYTRIS